jgi:hypothetical protein
MPFKDPVQYSEAEIKKIQIDRILRIQSRMCSNLGVSSTKEEKAAVKARIKRLDLLIKKIDKDFFEFIKEDK